MNEEGSTEEAPDPPPSSPSKEVKAKKEAPEKDERSMGQLFRDEPMLQKALDMFDGEVLP